MEFFTTLIVLSLCFSLMAIGLLFSSRREPAGRKVLRRGCSIDPDACACLKEGKPPEECDK
jgi:hypothetical protein